MAWIAVRTKQSTKNSLFVGSAAGDMTSASGMARKSCVRSAFHQIASRLRRSDCTKSRLADSHRRLIAIRDAAATDPALLQHNGDPAVSYFNLEFNPQMATSLVHCLNRRYKGAQKFPVTAPDAQGSLIVWARDL